MRLVAERALLFGMAAVVALRAGNAWADSAIVDPSHGRIDGDIDVVVGVGGVVAPRGLRGEVELRLRYLETAGVYAAYEDGGVFGSASEPKRLLAAGLEVRPLFLLRWLRGYETQSARFDLALDSMGLELGVIFQQPMGAGFASQRGFEVGFGIELPIAANATGPWVGIRAALRWNEAALASAVVDGADDRQAVMVVTLAWHQIAALHVVDVGDRAPR